MASLLAWLDRCKPRQQVIARAPSAYNLFIKEWIQGHPGKKLAQAADAWTSFKLGFTEKRPGTIKTARRSVAKKRSVPKKQTTRRSVRTIKRSASRKPIATRRSTQKKSVQKRKASFIFS